MISRMFRGDDENTVVKRKRQIDTLKIFNDNVVEFHKDAEYHVRFHAGNVHMSIIITLSSEFPLEKPVLRISPAVIHHPWCNEHSEIVNAPGLINFTVHSDLGRVVQVIIREFSKNPPIQFNKDTLSLSNTSNLADLDSLSDEKLIELDEDCDDKYRDAFSHEFSRLDEIHSSIDETIKRVEEMADENLAREFQLKTLQNQVTSKIQSVSALKIRFDNLIQRYNSLSEAFAPDHIKECLKYAADDSHEQSERIAERFLEGTIEVERFLTSYIECRKLGQARRTKEEKLAHQLNEFKRAGY